MLLRINACAAHLAVDEWPVLPSICVSTCEESVWGPDFSTGMRLQQVRFTPFVMPPQLGYSDSPTINRESLWIAWISAIALMGMC